MKFIVGAAVAVIGIVSLSGCVVDADLSDGSAKSDRQEIKVVVGQTDYDNYVCKTEVTYKNTGSSQFSGDVEYVMETPNGKEQISTGSDYISRLNPGQTKTTKFYWDDCAGVRPGLTIKYKVSDWSW